MFDPVTYILAKKGGGGGGTRDFEELSNRPKYNGSSMDGATDIPEVPTSGEDITYDSGAAHTEGSVSAELESLSTAVSGLQDEISGINTLLGSGDFT